MQHERFAAACIAMEMLQDQLIAAAVMLYELQPERNMKELLLHAGI